MDGTKIFKTFLKIVAWIAGFVIVPIISAIGLAAAFKWEFQSVLYWFGAFYILCFVLAFLVHLIRDYIRKQVYEILKQEGISTQKKRKEEQDDE